MSVVYYRDIIYMLYGITRGVNTVSTTILTITPLTTVLSVLCITYTRIKGLHASPDRAV